jgi:pimeloyl-ACP methyl ester carboxylesterase
MKKAYTDIPEGQVHYRIDGTGEVILLLHASVSSSDEYARVMPFLSKKYCAVAMDFLGNGNSDPAPYQYSVADHARTALSFMDALGIKQAIIVGQHIGAKMAVEMAVTHPERVRKLVLSNIGYYPKPEEGLGAVIDPPNYTGMVEIKADGSHVMEWWRRSTAWGHPLEVVEESFLEKVKAGPRGEEMHWAGEAYDPRPKLPLIKCPTQVISATKDVFSIVQQTVHSLIPGSTLTVIQDGPIDINRVWPKEFAEAILNYLDTSNTNK